MNASEAMQEKGLTERQIIERLFQLGHFHNPRRPTGVEGKDLGKITLDDDAAHQAVRSYQEYLAADFNTFASKHHDRPAIADGDLGPATVELIAEPRCGLPDYPVPGAMASVEQANWPTACRGKLKFGRSFRTMPGLSEEDTAGVWWAICHNITQALADVEMSPAEIGDRAVHIFAELGRLARGVLAQSYLAQNRCDVTLGQIFNSMGVDWGDIALTCATGTHEVLHALGWGHSSDPLSTSYPSIQAASRARYGYLNPTDLKMGEQLGYKPSGLPQLPRDRLFLPRTSGPEPDGPSGDVTISGSLEVRQGDKLLRRFVVVPVREF